MYTVGDIFDHYYRNYHNLWVFFLSKWLLPIDYDLKPETNTLNFGSSWNVSVRYHYKTLLFTPQFLKRFKLIRSFLIYDKKRNL